MDLEALRLALAQAEAKARRERRGSTWRRDWRARRRARRRSRPAVAARDENLASSAAADTASSLLVALEDERRARRSRASRRRCARWRTRVRLADAESRLARASKERDVALTERDVALRRAAMASASAQRSQSASAGVSIARDAPEMPVRFELRGVPDVEPGYRVVAGRGATGTSRSRHRCRWNSTTTILELDTGPWTLIFARTTRTSINTR